MEGSTEGDKRESFELSECWLVQREGTDVFASHTSKKNQNAIFVLAAALYGLTRAPGTGPFAVETFGMWVVFSRAFIAHHMAKSDMEAAKQTRSWGNTSR